MARRCTRFGLTGLADAVLRASTADRECWVARFGRIVEKRPGDQQGVMYDTLVNAIRAEIPGSVSFIHAKVTDIAAGPERRTVKLSNGEEISARLVVVATGLNPGVREKLGIERDIISAGHSISIGFDAKPADPNGFPFPALTYFSESPADRMAYITLFPIGTAMRANLFGYRHLHDPWLKQLRETPRQTLYGIWPGLRRLMGDFTVDASSRFARSISMSPEAIGSTVSCWSATHSRRHVPPRAPVRASCWSMSSGCATCTFRAGLRRPAWAKKKSRRSMTIRSNRPAIAFRPRRPSACARSRLIRRSSERRSAGRSSACIGAKARCAA